MSLFKKKILVVCGPTATGKSDLAVQLALKENGEVISADSRQVYKDCPLATGAITTEEMLGIPHHLLAFQDIREQYSVTDFVRDAKKLCEEIWQRGKTPIICGGTSFYIDALIFDLPLTEITPNEKLRAELSQISAEELFEKLLALDPDRAKNIDKQNPRRLIRALEIAEEMGASPKIEFPIYSRPTIAPTEWHYLDFSDEILKERILKRINIRIEKGMIEEIKKLLDQGVPRERLIELGLEFKYTTLFLENFYKTKNDFINELATKTFQYAKRQRTWLKRNPNI